MDRLRSTLAAPGGARLIGALVALVGVVLLVVGVVALGGGDSGSSGAAPAPSPSVATSPATPSRVRPARRRSAGPAPTTAPHHDGRPAAAVELDTDPGTTTAARAPLTVLNNSTIRGLADRAAGEVQNRGWQVAQVGNFAGRLAATTVYYTPGDGAGQAAARTSWPGEFPPGRPGPAPVRRACRRPRPASSSS